MVGIPPWSAEGVLPPVDEHVPTSSERSPYNVSIVDFVRYFAITPERAEILRKYLHFRGFLHGLGIIKGFQWVDGSFSEHIEILEGRNPRDIDVVSFIYTMGLSDEQASSLEYGRVQSAYSVDGYFVELDQFSAEEIVAMSAYWYGLWSHRRNMQWKGFLQVDLCPDHDKEAMAVLSSIDNMDMQP